MEGTPKSKFDTLVDEMKLKGFNYYCIDSTHETRGVSGKNRPDGIFRFVTEQFQTTEEMKEKYKNLPEFSEVKDKMEVELVEDINHGYYVFIKIKE